MNPGDEVLYPNPGYPIYESQIEFHGGKALPYRYLEGEDNFRSTSTHRSARSRRGPASSSSTTCRTRRAPSAPRPSARRWPSSC